MFDIKVEPIDRDIAIILDEELSAAARSKVLAASAREALGEAKEQNEQAFGVVPPYDTTVDGSTAKSEDQVNPDGIIVYEFRLITDALDWIDQQLIAHSPVKTGRYQRSHVLFVDGTETDPEHPAEGQEFIFVNTQPYSRKIEKGESPSAPDGVYEGVALQASRQFGNLARISFDYRAVREAADQSAARPAQSRQRSARDSRQPAIVIEAI